MVPIVARACAWIVPHLNVHRPAADVILRSVQVGAGAGTAGQHPGSLEIDIPPGRWRKPLALVERQSFVRQLTLMSTNRSNMT